MRRKYFFLFSLGLKSKPFETNASVESVFLHNLPRPLSCTLSYLFSFVFCNFDFPNIVKVSLHLLYVARIWLSSSPYRRSPYSAVQTNGWSTRATNMLPLLTSHYIRVITCMQGSNTTSRSYNSINRWKNLRVM